MKKCLLLFFCLSVLTAVAQKKKSENNEPAPAPPPPSNLEAKTAAWKKFQGFVEFYIDEKQDKIYLLIDKWDKEFLYVESLTAGVGSNDLGLDRNKLGRERVVRFERRGPKVFLTETNLGFRAESNNAAERRAVEEAFARSILWGFTVMAEENARVLVDATDFFVQDAFDVTGTLRIAQQGNYNLDKSRSALYLERTKNFPQNSEVEVTLTLTGNATGGFIRSVVPTPSSVTVREHHSFIQLPDLDYKPRKFDPRSGFFNIAYFDYATPFSQPIQKRYIARHRLKKKDPAAALSEAVKPIIYYMDPGAPEPIRSALMEGARWWNQAFEAAGYKDAFRVELLPEDADPMDVRYNVINWVHRSTRGWSYGASISDPRTGEILKGHVTLGSLRVRQDYLIAEGLLAPYENGTQVAPEAEKMALQRLRQLAAHEVGHTLGLSHAYSSSSEGRASVMDYPHPYVKLTNGKIDLSDAYTNEIGPFDKVAVTWGYQDFPPGTDEDKSLNDIIANSLKNGLTFLSDQDARPVGGAHPYTHLWDNGKDPAEELLRVLEIRATALRNFGANNIRTGAPMATLEEVLVPIYFFHRYQAEAASKIIGGVNYRYALKGDGQPVTELLTPQQEINALDALLKTVQPQALTLPESLLKQIPPRPLGYSRHRELIRIRTELTFDPLSMAETAADMTFSLLFNSARANRIFEHHSRDARLPSLENVMDRTALVTLKAAPRPGHEGAVQMAVASALMSNMIRLASDPEATTSVRAIATLRLTQWKVWLTQRVPTTTDESWKAFYSYLSGEMSKFEEDPAEYKRQLPLAPPPGQPIGDEDEGAFLRQN